MGHFLLLYVFQVDVGDKYVLIDLNIQYLSRWDNFHILMTLQNEVQKNGDLAVLAEERGLLIQFMTLNIMKPVVNRPDCHWHNKSYFRR